MADTRKLRAIKIALWEQDCHCHWCGIGTTLIHVENGILPDNAATIEHLEGVLLSGLGKRNHDHKKLVLACYKCNHDKGNELVNNCPREKWLALSTMPPKRRVNNKKQRRRIKKKILNK